MREELFVASSSDYTIPNIGSNCGLCRTQHLIPVWVNDLKQEIQPSTFVPVSRLIRILELYEDDAEREAVSR